MASDSVFIDTSAFYAFFDKKDRHHDQVSQALYQTTASFVTSNYVLDELITLFRMRRLRLHQFQTFVEKLWTGSICQILRVTEEIEMKAWELLKQYQDHDFSFTDCTSFVLMRTHKLQQVCTLDHHFAIAGFEMIVQSALGSAKK
ncbi:MAG: type II toxin-antitoxin system VapC family toxin [SAR324 cluster bacterium]|nr:type II toxin-antitoxin system VapC family toxin [SAR324 cluster bacterium]